MKLLLDTNVLLLAAAEPERLSPAARKLLGNPKHELVFSAVSLWEVAIKASLGRDDFRVDPRRLRRALVDNGYLELDLTGEHAVGVDLLPPIHRDPFDRMLISQALSEGITFVTRDTLLRKYPGSVVVV